jgi:hypothetical protein
MTDLELGHRSAAEDTCHVTGEKVSHIFKDCSTYDPSKYLEILAL